MDRFNIKTNSRNIVAEFLLMAKLGYSFTKLLKKHETRLSQELHLQKPTSKLLSHP